MTDWITHDSTEPPVLDGDVLVEVIDNHGDDYGPDLVDGFCWDHISHYRLYKEVTSDE